MNKLFSILAVSALLNFGYVSNSYAQDAEEAAATEEMTTDGAAMEGEDVANDSAAEAVTEEPMAEEEPTEEAAPAEEEAPAPEKSFHQVVKDKFIAGKEFVMRNGGCVILVDNLPEYSTTSVIKIIQDRK